MRATGELWMFRGRRRPALAAAALVAWLCAACGDDGAVAKDLGIREGGARDGAIGGGDGARPDGAAGDGAPAGELANLTVSWTIDGAADDPAGRCAKYGVDYFSLVVRVDAPTGKEVLSQGFMCGAGAWDTGEGLHGLLYGPYAVTLTAASGACCSGGKSVAVGSRKLWLKQGTTTAAIFNLADGKFDPAP